MAGHFKLQELDMRRPDGDPVIDLATVCAYNEAMIIECENNRRAQKAAEDKAKRNRKRGRGR